MFLFIGVLFVLLIFFGFLFFELMLLVFFLFFSLCFCCFERDVGDVDVGVDGEMVLIGLLVIYGEISDIGVLMFIVVFVCLMFVFLEGILYIFGVLRCNLVIGWEKLFDFLILFFNFVLEIVVGFC